MEKKYVVFGLLTIVFLSTGVGAVVLNNFENVPDSVDVVEFFVVGKYGTNWTTLGGFSGMYNSSGGFVGKMFVEDSWCPVFANVTGSNEWFGHYCKDSASIELSGTFEVHPGVVFGTWNLRNPDEGAGWFIARYSESPIVSTKGLI